MNEPYELCNRYSGCSVNNCPLDPEYPDRYTDPSDSETKCGYAKSYRIKIAEQFPGMLKFGGMTQREYKYKQAWDNLSEDEKQRRIQRINEINAKKYGRPTIERDSNVLTESFNS